MKALLQTYAADSAELVSRYLAQRHREQERARVEEDVHAQRLGSLTVRAQLLREHLRVEVLNARQLRPPDIR